MAYRAVIEQAGGRAVLFYSTGDGPGQGTTSFCVLDRRAEPAAQAARAAEFWQFVGAERAAESETP